MHITYVDTVDTGRGVGKSSGEGGSQMARNSAYHHGNLRADLIAAGLTLTRTGGPQALSLREATRAVGVTPSAAYRHFASRGALVAAVAAQVQDRMADRMLAHWPRGSGAEAARARLHAVGIGYIEFALAEPGWFATFFGPEPSVDPEAPDGQGDTGAPARVPPPFALLTQALDELAGAGQLSASARTGAEWPCWSAVHGFAHLVIAGPLRSVPEEQRRQLAEATVTAIIDGVCARS